MKFRPYLFVLAIAIAAVACSGKKSLTPLQINEKFVHINDTLRSYGNEFAQKLRAAMTTKDFSEVSDNRPKIEGFIKDKQKELREMDDVKGSGDFRKAMLNFLDYQMKMCNSMFEGADKLKANPSEEEINAFVTNLMAMSKEENQRLEEVRTTQQAFAKKNNITIVNFSPPVQ
jgi:hypothetical protein